MSTKMLRLEALEVIQLFRKPGGDEFILFCNKVIRVQRLETKLRKDKTVHHEITPLWGEKVGRLRQTKWKEALFHHPGFADGEKPSSTPGISGLSLT